jgi:hypothetical protein
MNLMAALSGLKWVALERLLDGELRFSDAWRIDSRRRQGQWTHHNSRDQHRARRAATSATPFRLADLNVLNLERCARIDSAGWHVRSERPQST